MCGYSAIVFDLDGVVYKGAQGIPGVAAEIARLQKILKVLFLTNNATKSRADYLAHLAGFGIAAKQDDIMTSSFGLAHFVREKFGKGKTVFVIGESGLKRELEGEAGAKITEGKSADIVAVGLDRRITYEKLDSALQCLNSGAKFILANNDPTYPTESGVSPGSGAMAASLIFASGRQPDVIIGKPSTYLIEKLLEMRGVEPKSAAFVGDRLEIDIRMANKMGMKSILVLTGIAREKDAQNAKDGDKPHLVLASAAEAGKALGV